MTAEISIAPVLEQYPGLGPIRRTHSLANAGGFSGSLLWRIEREAGDLCLRRWPAEYPAERLDFIHGVLKQLWARGVRCIPLPVFNRSGDTFVDHDAYLWELTPWMPGTADFHSHPSRERLRSVMTAVARLHRVSEEAWNSSLQVSPTLLSRREQLHQLLAGQADSLAAAVERHGNPLLQDRGRRLLAHLRSLGPELALKIDSVGGVRVSLFPVVRDLWHDHVLFTGDALTGLVDFGAMRVDSAACDLSRLLGSLVPDDEAIWDFAMGCYGSARFLSTEERSLTYTLDEANVVLAGLNWIEWICLEGRTFEDMPAILARLDGMLARLRAARRSNRC